MVSKLLVIVFFVYLAQALLGLCSPSSSRVLLLLASLCGGLAVRSKRLQCTSPTSPCVQMGKGKVSSSSSSSEDESSSSSSSSSSSVSDGARRREQKKHKRSRSARAHKNDSKPKKAKSKKRSDRASSRGSRGSLPAGSVEQTVRGRLVLPADQVMGQAIPLANGKEGTCAGVLYFTKARKWMYKAFTNLVFLPDNKISKSQIVPLVDALPERVFVKADDDEKGSFVVQDRSLQQKLQATVKFANAFNLESRAVTPNVGVVYTKDVVKGTNRDLVSALYQITADLGLTATGDDSEITKASMLEFFNNRGVDLNAKANPVLSILGKRSHETAAVVDPTDGAGDQGSSKLPAVGGSDDLHVPKKKQTSFADEHPREARETTPPATTDAASTKPGSTAMSTPDRAASLKRQLDAMGCVLVDKDLALRKGLWAEPAATPKSAADERAEKIGQLVQLNRLPATVTAATTKDDIDGLVFASLKKQWKSVNSLQKIMDPAWLAAHPQGSVTAADYKSVMARTYRDYVWDVLFPGETPSPSFWETGVGASLFDKKEGAMATPPKTPVQKPAEVPSSAPSSKSGKEGRSSRRASSNGSA